MAQPTTTSEEILEYLVDNGFKLTPKHRDFIRGKIYDAVSDAYKEQSNGCDCGQPSCPRCN